jgi:hypothetical protein
VNAYAIQKGSQTVLRVCVQVRITNWLFSKRLFTQELWTGQAAEKSRPVIHRTDLHSTARTFRRLEITLISYEEGHIHENFIYW